MLERSEAEDAREQKHEVAGLESRSFSLDSRMGGSTAIGPALASSLELAPSASRWMRSLGVRSMRVEWPPPQGADAGAPWREAAREPKELPRPWQQSASELPLPLQLLLRIPLPRVGWRGGCFLDFRRQFLDL